MMAGDHAEDRVAHVVEQVVIGDVASADQLDAGLVEAGSLQVSDLMVGGPTYSRDDLLQPTVGYSVVFGSVHGYVEAYGSGAGTVTATYEIARDVEEAALVSEQVTAITAGDARAIFTRVMPVNRLPCAVSRSYLSSQ